MTRPASKLTNIKRPNEFRRLFVAILCFFALVFSASEAIADQPSMAPPSGKDILNAKDPRTVRYQDIAPRASMSDVIAAFASDPSIQDVMKKLDEDLKVDQNEQNLRWSAGMFEAKNSSTERGIHVANKFRESGEKKLVKALSTQLGLDERLKKGLEIDVNFGSTPAPSDDSRRPAVTYGLVVDELSPSKSQVLTASPYGIDSDSMMNAPKSDVKYRIGPKPATKDSYQKVVLGHEEESLKLPSPSFKGRIKSRDQEPGAQAPGEGLPPMVMGLYQTENYYRVEYKTKENMSKDGVYQGIAVPIKGRLQLDQELSQNFSPVRTSAKGLLYEKHQPQLDVHFYSPEQKYESDLILNQSEYNLNFKAHSSSPVTGDGPKYEMGFSTDF